MNDVERGAWIKMALIVMAMIIMAVFFAHCDEERERAAYEKGRQSALAEARRASYRVEAQHRAETDHVRRECEEECDDNLARQRGALVEQIEECQGELVVSRINERR